MTEQNVAGLNPGVEVDFEDNVNPVCGSEVGQLGAAQRLRISVPNVYTQLTLGQALGGDDDQGFAYAGFGVSTEGNIYQRADLTSTYQSQGHTSIHAYGEGSDVYLGANRKVAIAAATENVFVAGGGGVTISGGVPWAPVGKIGELGEQTVEPPQWLTATASTAESVSTLWSTVDAVAAGINSGLAIARGAFSMKNSIASNLWNGFNVLIDVLNIAGNAGLDPFNGTTIHGHSGLIMGTFGTMGIYSGAGTGMMSTIGVQILAPSVSAEGLKEATLQSAFDTEVSGGRHLHLVGGKSSELACRAGGLALKGARIAIGSKAGAGGQKETNVVGVYGVHVAMAAKKNAMLTGKESVSIRGEKAVVQGDKVTVTGKTKLAMAAPTVAIRGTDDVAIGTPGYFINIGSSSLKLGNVQSEIPPAPVYTPPRLDEILAALGSDTPMCNLREFKGDVEQAVADHEKAWHEWADKAGALEAKNCSIELKDGDITLEVHGFKFKIDSAKTAVGNTLKIMK